MTTAEELRGEEVAEWYRLTPQQRWAETCRMWSTFIALGGNTDPEPDTQSPFFDEQEWRELFAHGRSGVRSIRRSGV